MATASANNTWQKWHDELELAKKAKGFKTWQTRAIKIIRRYRDERSGASDDSDSYGVTDAVTGARFNILWSNVQTLLPAVFAKTPKPVVERRYLDRDEVGRTASVILERALLYELDNGTYYSSLRKAVLDRLLPGRGVVWVRYEPKFTDMPNQTQVDTEAKDKVKPDQEVASESAPIDYIDWQDFGTSPSRIWEDVWYLWKRVYMTRKELVKRFGAVGEKVPLDWSPDKSRDGASSTPASGETDGEKRAKIIELWDKTDRKVYWFAEGWSDAMLDTKEDPLQLEHFWPTPKPLFATLTNDSLVPVPDYYEYQDQAMELDDLTTRIANLTKTIKACGVYDASVNELQRMFEEGFENRLVPADNMAEFMAKAGPNGMGHLWLLPVKDLVFTLNELYKARAEVKQSLYEITGISDIVRGASADGGAKTATEQRIKGQFASMRLNEMQAEVSRFARDVLRIVGEIIAEHYDPMTLYLISGYEQYAKEQFPPEPANPMMGHNQGPPMGPQGAPVPGAAPTAGALLPPGGAPIITPEQAAQKKAAEMFTKAVELLRNDKLRGFRIDIETDSLIEPDQQATQQARTELLGALSQFLPQAMEAGQTMPELKPLMARLLMFFLRGFKASRDIESAFEQFIDDLTKEAANPQPKPPSPEELKAQAEMKKQEMETQRMQMQAQIDQQTAMADLDMQKQKHAMELEKMQAQLAFEQQKIALKREEMQLDAQMKAAQAQQDLALKQREGEIEAEGMEREAEITDRTLTRQEDLAVSADERSAEADQRKHDLAIETAEHKAKQAKVSKPSDK